MTDKINSLGKYNLTDQLGSGLFGTVFAATDLTGRNVAIKVSKPGLLDESPDRIKFRQEIKKLGLLYHGRIANILDYDESEDCCYIVMRYIDGLSLDKIIKQNGLLSWEKTIQILNQIASGLDYAHKNNLIHRDIKPSNILVSDSDGAILTDFGLLKAVEVSSGPSQGMILGSPAYIAPEIWSGKAESTATDVYSLACVTFEMLKGRVLFEGRTTPEIMTRHMLSEIDLPDDWADGVPAGVKDVLARALVKDPEKRIQSATGFVNELVRLSGSTEALDSEALYAELEAHKQAEELARKSLLLATEQARQESDRARRAIMDAAKQSQKIEYLESQNEKLQQELMQYIRTAKHEEPYSEEEKPKTEKTKAEKQPSKNPSLIILRVIFILTGLAVLAILAILYYQISGLGKVAPTPAPIIVQVTRVATEKPAFVATNVPSAPAVAGTPSGTNIVAGKAFQRKKDGMVMVYIPPGPFIMGSDNWSAVEKPAHSYKLASYYIDQTEVTNGMYSNCVNDNVCLAPLQSDSNTRPYFGVQQYVNYPAIWVNWNMAVAYCFWAGARLPTEAEWEKAARGTDGRTYPWGEGFDQSRANLSNIQDTTAVGNFPTGASSYGTLDMAGNVWEWVADWLQPYQGGDYKASGYFGTSYRVAKGGGFLSVPNDARSSNRRPFSPDFSSSDLGFRCASSSAP